MKRLVSIALILFFGITTGSNAQTLRKTEPVVGGALCHYSDGSVIKKRGDSYCERSLKRQRDDNEEKNQNRRNNRSKSLIRTESVVGGARCYYSDGSVISKKGDSYCPR